MYKQLYESKRSVTTSTRKLHNGKLYQTSPSIVNYRKLHSRLVLILKLRLYKYFSMFKPPASFSINYEVIYLSIKDEVDVHLYVFETSLTVSINLRFAAVPSSYFMNYNHSFFFQDSDLISVKTGNPDITVLSANEMNHTLFCIIPLYGYMVFVNLAFYNYNLSP